MKKEKEKIFDKKKKKNVMKKKKEKKSFSIQTRVVSSFSHTQKMGLFF